MDIKSIESLVALAAEKKVKISRDDYISVTTVHGVERISLGQILYVEAEAHRITYHLTERKITYSGTLSACEKAPFRA